MSAACNQELPIPATLEVSTSQTMPAIALLGAVPPPFGGVSVHLVRLIEKLKRCGVDYRLYDLNGRCDKARHVLPAARTSLWLIRFLLFCRERIVHLHVESVVVMLLAAWILPLRSRALLITLHGASQQRWYASASSFWRFLFRTALRRVTRMICVNHELAQWMTELGLRPDQISTFPAFISPSVSELDPNNIPAEAKQFAAAHAPLIGSHGWFGPTLDGIHLYSFDMLGHALRQLRQRYPSVGLYTVVSGSYEKEHRDVIYRLRKELELEESWLILEKPFVAASLFAITDVFVRPTITDGDSVSIRECLALGIPVVASDSVERPPACHLFSNRNLHDMVESLCNVIDASSAEHETEQHAAPLDAADQSMAVYSQIHSGLSST